MVKGLGTEDACLLLHTFHLSPSQPTPGRSVSSQGVSISFQQPNVANPGNVSASPAVANATAADSAHPRANQCRNRLIWYKNLMMSSIFAPPKNVSCHTCYSIQTHFTDAAKIATGTSPAQCIFFNICHSRQPALPTIEETLNTLLVLSILRGFDEKFSNCSFQLHNSRI